MSQKQLPRQIDRRYIYLILLLGVMVPLLVPLGFISEVSDLSKRVYEMVETTPENSVVMLSFDYDPSTGTELQPMAKALIEHAWKKNHRLIAVALWPQGVQMAELAFADVLKRYPDQVYGTNYVNLGFKSGGMVTIQAMGRNFKEVFPTDSKGTPVSQLQMLETVRNFNQIGYVVSLSAGDPGLKGYIMTAHDMYGVKVSGGCTAVSTPGFLPYVNDQNQLYGLLGGLKGAAEYESMLDVKGTATSGMDAQSIAHLLIIAFIIMGNLRARKIKKLSREN
ncbi:MAG: hypothetical protein R6V77_07920 [Candidatus Cloacimonadaceae bacterium]